MLAPQPPPKRKNHKPVATYGSGSGIPVPVGSAHNVARAISENNYVYNNSRPEQEPTHTYPTKHAEKVRNGHSNRKPNNRIGIIEDESDAVIGAGVEMHGEFQFDKLLRVDGKFQGNLFSNNKGDIIVGKAGCIIGDVIIARKMIVEGGHVIGKVVVEELLLLNHTIIKGDITCKLLQIEGPNVTINGRANVHALAPELVDEYNNIITEIPKKNKKPKKEIYAPRSPGRKSVTEPVRNHENDDESPHTDSPLPQSNQPSPPIPSPSKSTSAQTYASAKPPARSSHPTARDAEEAAALDAAMAERNAAKERHKQAKLAKKGGGAAVAEEEEVNTPAPLSVDPPAHSEPQSQAKSPTKSPAKSPSKLLPPSEEQRKAQLLKDSGGAGADKFDSPDVEREKAAVNVQRIARGRLVRRDTQSNDADAKDPANPIPNPPTAAVPAAVPGDDASTDAAKSTKPEGEQPSAADTDNTHDQSSENKDSDVDMEKQNSAAVGLQKIARGKLARNNAAAVAAAGKKSEGADNDQPVTDPAPSAAPAASEAPAAAAAGDAQADPAGGQAGPFGPGYAESLVQNS